MMIWKNVATLRKYGGRSFFVKIQACHFPGCSAGARSLTARTFLPWTTPSLWAWGLPGRDLLYRTNRFAFEYIFKVFVFICQSSPTYIFFQPLIVYFEYHPWTPAFRRVFLSKRRSKHMIRGWCDSPSPISSRIDLRHTNMLLTYLKITICELLTLNSDSITSM